jgi:alpha-ketoglutarate-dependent taurine dioxygenase
MKSIRTKLITSTKLPLVMEPEDHNITLPQLLDLVRNENGYFRKNLLEHGGLLLRNFPIQNEHDFAAVIHNLQLGNFIDYIGGDSPRKKIIDGVYTSTEAPPSIKIALHNELSFVKNYPKHIYFYCAIPPVADGETIIADARKVYASMNKEVRERFLEKGLRYVSCYPFKDDFMNFINKSHKSWIDVFETEDKAEVERKCHENEFSFHWHPKDWLKISQTRPAAITHPQTGEDVWFNQAHLFDFNPKLLGRYYLAVKLLYCRKHTKLHEVFFADDTKIARKDLYHVLDVLDANTVRFPWQKGDMLILDNILSMHGRATYKGKRRVLTAMTG